MSNYPGYPPPFSAWDSFTSTNRTPFPLGNLSVPIPGFPPGVPSLIDPGYFPLRPAFSDPLTLGAGVYRPLPSRYIPGLNELPVLGLEPLYGFGPQEPRSLLHSPNFAFSQNPSPLTFEQIYRSSGASSVSPVSQYRNQIDQRYLGGHLGLPGRYSEPLCGQSRIPVPKDTTEKKDKCSKEEVTKTSEIKPSEVKKTAEKSVKLWNPFVSDLPEEKDLSGKEKTEVKVDEKVNISERKKDLNSDIKEKVDANGNTVVEVEKDVKAEQEIKKPQFPLRPIPVFSSHYQSRHFDQFQTPQLPSQLFSVCKKPKGNIDTSSEDKTFDTLKEQVHEEDTKEIIEHKEDNNVENDAKDLNQNFEIVKNSNLVINDKSSEKAGNTEENVENCDVNCSEVDINHISVNCEDINQNDQKKSEKVENNKVCAESCDKKQKQSSEKTNTLKNKVDFQSEFSNFLAKSVPLDTNVHVNISASLPDLEESSNTSEKQKENQTQPTSPSLCSPKGGEQKVHLPGNCKQKSCCSKKEELKQLSIQVNEVRKRRNSKETCSDKVLSPPLESTPKSKSLCTRGKERRFSHPPTGQPATPRHHRNRMASTEGAITMMKNTEDSLSASISSSHLSESDSDTQMSNDHPDKLFRESQPMNTQSSFSPNQSLDQNYLPSLNVDQMNHDNQYYKTNNPQMCQSETDNQKPYPCVQEETMFNEKPTVLPPFSCYASNQSTDVLPREPSFHSQEENSNFPPNLGVDPSMEYDENSVMSDNTQMQQDCESQHSISHNVEPVADKDTLPHSSNHTIENPESYIHDPGQWDFLHSKQYIENIYGNQIGCEIVKSEEESLRESDSPKTFLDLDTTTKEKRANEDHKGKVTKESLPTKHYVKSYSRQVYAGSNRHTPIMYGSQSVENYGNGNHNRWNSFRGEAVMRNQPRAVIENYGGHYEQSPGQFRGNYPQNYTHMNQGQNGGEKTYIQPSYHGNEYNQNEYYNQNQSMKNYQGNYSNNPRFENNYYQNKGGSEYNTQGNIYPSNSGDMQGSSRFGNQGFSGGQGGYGQHYTQPPAPHSGSDGMGQYPENTSYSIPRNASPASTGSDFSNMEAPPGIVKKKRGRKRKVEKEPPDENKPRPNTVVMAPTKIGPLIDIDNPECTIDTYDYNNQIETIFNFTIEDDLTPIGAQYLQIEQRICQKMLPIKYGYPVTVVYSPLTYAFQTHRDFVSKFCTSERTILFLGMNPGPYGMSQNGVSNVLNGI